MSSEERTQRGSVEPSGLSMGPVLKDFSSADTLEGVSRTGAGYTAWQRRKTFGKS